MSIQISLPLYLTIQVKMQVTEKSAEVEVN